MGSRRSACLLLRLAVLALVGSALACDDDHFQCDNGQCALLYLICDGVKDCDDGSDEKPEKCNSAASSTLGVGDSLTATVQYQYEHKGLIFRLCSDSWCSALYVWGANATGTLKFFQNTHCNIWGAYCETSVDSQTDGWEYFPTGEMVFVVKRQQSELSLSLVGDEANSISVSVTDDSHNLHIRPEYWIKDMPVTLDSGTTTTVPVTSTSVPVTSTRAPVTSKTVPVTSTSAPVTFTSGPVTSTSGTVTTTAQSTTPSAASRVHVAIPLALMTSVMLKMCG